MPQYCSVPQCKNYNASFRFPQDLALKLKWRLAIRRMAEDGSLYDPRDHDRVCDKHFLPTDFREHYSTKARIRRWLKPNSVPSVFPWTEGEQVEEEKVTGRGRRNMKMKMEKDDFRVDVESIQHRDEEEQINIEAIKYELGSDGEEAEDDPLRRERPKAKQPPVKLALESDDIMQTMSSLTHLNTLKMGRQWILIQRNQFDVILDHQPYQTLQIVVNLVNKLFLIRVWGRTYDQGIVNSAKDLKIMCLMLFDFRLVCKGLGYKANEEMTPVDFPIRRFISKDCKELFKTEDGLSNRKGKSLTSDEETVSLCGPCSKELNEAQPSKSKATTSSTVTNQQDLQDRADQVDIKIEPVDEDEETQDDPGNPGEEEQISTQHDNDELSESNPRKGKLYPKSIKDQVKQAEEHMLQNARKMMISKKKKRFKDVYQDRLKCKCGKFAQKISETTVEEPDKEVPDGRIKVEEILQCWDCKTKFKRVKMVIQDSKPKEPIKKSYTCKICGSRYNDLTEYVDHHQTHTAERKLLKEYSSFYKCSECSRYFDKEASLRLHHKRDHPGVECPMPPAVDPSLPTIMCEICGEDIQNNFDSMRKHMAIVHAEGMKCEVCSQVFYDPEKLHRHKVIHREATFPCPSCGKLFRSERFARNHEEKVHKNILRVDVVCEVCNQRFINKMSFNNHIKVKHPDSIHLLMAATQKKKDWMIDKIKKEREAKRKKEEEEKSREQERAVQNMQAHLPGVVDNWM